MITCYFLGRPTAFFLGRRSILERIGYSSIHFISYPCNTAVERVSLSKSLVLPIAFYDDSKCEASISSYIFDDFF